MIGNQGYTTSVAAEKGEYEKAFHKPENIYIRTGYTDGRRGIQKLIGDVSNMMGKNPASGDMYVFMSRSRRRMKILMYEGGCYYLTTVWSMDASFPWPMTESDAMRITRSQFMMLLDRIDFFSSSTFVKLASEDNYLK